MRTVKFLTCLQVLAPAALLAQEGADPSGDLAKQLANPISSLISVPFQANWDFGIGSSDATRYTLNVQPVVPLSISEDWNLIIRTIVPVIDAESPAPGINDASGLGDINQSFFFSPKEAGPGGVIWGAGPVFLFPTATDDLLGGEKWGVGPTFVALRQSGGLTYGALANHLWSVGGDSERTDISATYLQPFAAYTTKTQTTMTLSAESSYNWEMEQWSVPLNFAVSQVFKIGSQPVSFQVGGRYYVEGPDGGPEWGLRAAFTLLFPTARKAPAVMQASSK